MLSKRHFVFHAAMALLLVDAWQARAGSLAALLPGNMVDPAGNQVDSYLIHINPPYFLAGLVEEHVLPNGDIVGGQIQFDAIMYLFKADGTPVAATAAKAGFLPTLIGGPGSTSIKNLAEGDYKLVVTTFNNQAFDNSNSNLFTQPLPGSGFPPATPAPGVGPFDHFTQLGTYPGEPLTGSYVLVLTGVIYKGEMYQYEPEPSTITTLCIGMACLATYGSMRRTENKHRKNGLNGLSPTGRGI